ncbi:MAG TPA: cytochrome c3 family protein [Syntrophorhabdaceae bacterium]|nr:cytochrome c3 family protein [Syntrophorhabdaceae bacterium]
MDKKFFIITLFCGLIIISSLALSEITGFAVHQKSGVTCKECHLENEHKERVSNNQCLGCHGDIQKLVEKTNKVYPNPHASPHLDPGAIPLCTECHKIHKQSVVNCTECHPEFKFNVK